MLWYLNPYPKCVLGFEFWYYSCVLINISSVVEFQRWWVLKSKLFAQKSTCHQKFLRVMTVCQKVPKLYFQSQFWIISKVICSDCTYFLFANLFPIVFHGKGKNCNHETFHILKMKAHFGKKPHFGDKTSFLNPF